MSFSNDFKWNLHVEDIVKRCYRRIYILRNLYRAACPPHVIQKCYILFIRSLLLYCFSCFCNLSDYLFHRLLQVEKRAAKFFPTLKYEPLAFSSDAMCCSFFKKIHENVDHPLRHIFQSRVPTKRNPLTLKPPFSKTMRFYKSFIRFCK